MTKGNKSKTKSVNKVEAKANKALLSELPYYHCKRLEDAHATFNSLIDIPSRKSLSHLSSLYDINIFNLNNMNALFFDENQNYLYKFPRSKYFSPLSFNKELSQINSDSSFSIAHNNIRSLKRNFEEFQNQILSDLNIEFSIIGFTETRICNSDDTETIPSLPGYCFEFEPTPLSA